MLECVESRLLEFATDDIFKLLEDIEEVRLALVRLTARNRQEMRCNQPKAQEKGMPAARGPVGPGTIGHRIDRDGRKFVWRKIRAPTEEFPWRKNLKKRPTHRGKRRRKSTELFATLFKAETTLSQLVPVARMLPKRIENLYVLIKDTALHLDGLREKKQLRRNWEVIIEINQEKKPPDPVQVLEGSLTDNQDRTCPACVSSNIFSLCLLSLLLYVVLGQFAQMNQTQT